MKVKVLGILFILFCQTLMAQEHYVLPVRAGKEAADTGKFDASWQSLGQYQVPTWFRNAKFGIWAHWGPQCEAE